MSSHTYTYRLSDLVERLAIEWVGSDANPTITSLAPLYKAQAGQLSFLCDARYAKYLPDTKASAVILDAEHAARCPTIALISPNPRASYAKLATLFLRTPKPYIGIHPTAVIGERCRIPDSVSIGPHCVLGNDVTLGEGVILGAHCVLGDSVQVGDSTRLWASVVVYYGVDIGRDVTVHSGAVLGSNGFGMVRDDKGKWFEIPHLGAVIISDHVEIGANTTIDRGVLEDTIIETGVKLDNQIQIAHNVRIGESAVIAGCTGIGGSSTIGANCMLGGGVGISDHVNIADGVVLTGAATVFQDVPEPGVYSSGVGLQDHKNWRRNFIRFRELDKMAKQLNKLVNKSKVK